MFTKHRAIPWLLYISPFIARSPAKVSKQVFAPLHGQLAPLGIEVVIGPPGVVWEYVDTSGVDTFVVDPCVVVGLNGVVRSVVIVVLVGLSVVITDGGDCAVVGEVMADVKGMGVVVLAERSAAIIVAGGLVAASVVMASPSVIDKPTRERRTHLLWITRVIYQAGA